MSKLSVEEEQAIKAIKQAKGHLYELLSDLVENPDDVSMLPRLVVAMKAYRQADGDEKTATRLRLKKEGCAKENQAACIARGQRLSSDLRDAKFLSARERTELLKAQAEADRLEQLALQGRKKAIVQIALATGDLQTITEDRIQEVVNSQRRSNGGVIRIESGAGK